MKNMLKRDDKGFTLVELLIVMIIIGLLAAIAIPVFLNQKQKAIETSLRSDLRNLSQQQMVHGMENGFLSAAQIAQASPSYRASQTNNVYVLWATKDDFCLVGTSPQAGKDESGLAAQAGLSTKVFYVTKNGAVAPLTRTDQGCVLSGPSSISGGYFDSSGFRN